MANKVMVAMSGGVDSAAAAILMKRKYDSVIGGTMILCDGFDDYDAKRTANQIGITHYSFNLQSEFRTLVMDAFADSYKRGETPNPCIVCNQYVKFGLFIDKAQSLGCDRIVTGHYADIEFDAVSGRYLLKRADDDTKDQSYMLYRLSQNALSMCEFPLAHMTKAEIRRVAASAGADIAGKKDSQDICFIPDGDYRSFLRDVYGFNDKPGDFVLTDGTVLGKHSGLSSYTSGQRRGLGVSYKDPLYVLYKDPEKNSVVLGSDRELYKKRIKVRDCNWIAISELTSQLRAEVKIRYSHKSAKCTVFPVDNNNIEIELDEPQRAPTIGQSAVLYDGDTVIGGGIISL